MAINLFVVLVVMPVAIQCQCRDKAHDIMKSPYAVSRRRGGQLNLRGLYLMHRGLGWLADGLAGVVDKFIGTDDHPAAYVSQIAHEVVREQSAPRFPVLGVEIPAVASFQSLDRLDFRGSIAIDHPEGAAAWAASAS
jgi:hypothetical protein